MIADVNGGHCKVHVDLLAIHCKNLGLDANRLAIQEGLVKLWILRLCCFDSKGIFDTMQQCLDKVGRVDRGHLS